MRLSLVIACALLARDCWGRDAPRVEAPARAVPALEIELLGRRFLAADGAERTLMYDRAWPPRIRLHTVPKTPISVRFEAGTSSIALPFSRVKRAGSTVLRTNPPRIAPRDGTLVVEAEGFTPARAPIRWVRAPREIPTIEAVVTARTKGQYAEAERLARAALEDEDRITRLWAAVELARVALHSGDTETAVDRWIAAAEVARGAGLSSEVISRYCAAAFSATRAGQLGRAQALLEQADDWAEKLQDRATSFPIDFYRARIHSRLGDLREAGRLFRRVADLAMALDDPLAVYYKGGLAEHSRNVGRLAEAVQILETLVPERARLGPTDHASALNNLADAQMKAFIAGALAPDWDRAKGHIEEAIRLIHPLKQPWREATFLSTLAVVELERGEVEEANRHLDRAVRLHPSMLSADNPEVVALIRVRFAAGELGEARAVLREIEARQDPLQLEAALHLQAQRAAAANRPDALERFRTAFARMNANARRTALHGDRASFLASRRRLLDDYLRHAVAQGRLAEALVIADAASSLLLSDLDAEIRVARLSPEERAAWSESVERYHALRAELPKKIEACDRLPSARQGACARKLSEHRGRISDSIDAAFAILDEHDLGLKTEVRAATLLDAVDAGSALIVVWEPHAFLVRDGRVRYAPTPIPLESWIDETVQRLFVVGTDLTERALDGTPLPARLMLGHLPSARLLLEPLQRHTGPRVFVGDPTSDLPGARKEVLAAAGDEDVQLLGEAATRPRVRRALKAPTALFHFAGHAKVLGKDPWKSSLALADDPLTLEDLLLDVPAVDVVILSACASGADTGAIGLPHPFLLGGARAVLATSRPLRDAEAGSFIRRFYAAMGPTDPLNAYQAAVRASIAAGDPAWRAFRLFGR